MTLLTILFISIFFTVSQGADFLIISHPQSLSIYNQYEQPISNSERNNFLSYSPLEIVNKKEVFGDQITEALRFNYQGNIYYLLKDDKGEFTGKTAQLYQKTFTKCTILNDTVRLQKKITISEKEHSTGGSFSINKGELVTRVFRYGSKFYILKPANPARYGWYSGSSAVFSELKKVAKKTETAEISKVEDRIKSRLQKANKTYLDMFDYFNQITNQQKSVPEWNLQNNGKSIKCTLTGSNSMVMQMEQSTRYVVQDIEQMLLGEPFSVTYKSGILIIDTK